MPVTGSVVFSHRPGQPVGDSQVQLPCVARLKMEKWALCTGFADTAVMVVAGMRVRVRSAEKKKFNGRKVGIRML